MSQHSQREYLLFRLKGFLLAGLLIILDYNEFIPGELFSLLHAQKHEQTAMKQCSEGGHRASGKIIDPQSEKSGKSESGKQSNLLKPTSLRSSRGERFTHQFLASTEFVMKIND